MVVGSPIQPPTPKTTGIINIPNAVLIIVFSIRLCRCSSAPVSD
jgi:hypothetical protein